MKTIPTAAEIYKQEMLEDFTDYGQIQAMISFAKLHVEASQRAGYENNFFGISYKEYIKAYPLTNIK